MMRKVANKDDGEELEVLTSRLTSALGPFLSFSENHVGMAGSGTAFAEGAGIHRVAAGKEHGN